VARRHRRRIEWIGYGSGHQQRNGRREHARSAFAHQDSDNWRSGTVKTSIVAHSTKPKGSNSFAPPAPRARWGVVFLGQRAVAAAEINHSPRDHEGSLDCRMPFGFRSRRSSSWTRDSPARHAASDRDPTAAAQKHRSKRQPNSARLGYGRAPPGSVAQHRLRVVTRQRARRRRTIIPWAESRDREEHDVETRVRVPPTRARMCTIMYCHHHRSRRS